MEARGGEDGNRYGFFKARWGRLPSSILIEGLYRKKRTKQGGEEVGFKKRIQTQFRGRRR